MQNANAANQPNPVYQGGQFTDIEGLAKSLGAQYEYNPENGRVAVNGRYVPVVQNVGGTLRGNVYDVVRAAGGTVQGNPNTGYKVYGAGVTPVTGNPTTTAPTTPPPPKTAGAQEADMIFKLLDDVKPLYAAGDTEGAAKLLSSTLGISMEQARSNVRESMAGQKQAAPAQPQAATATSQPVAAAQTAAAQPPQVQLQPFTYQQQPIDYAALLSQASQQANMWATPQVDSLNRLRSLARGQYDMDVADVRNTLAADIAELRAGEAAREARVNEDMNRRGDAIYNSGIRFAGIRDQQIATQHQEVKLTQRAQNSLSKLASSLNLRLADLSDREASIRAQQGDKAMLTLQQLADKAETRAFENKKLTWQMWLQGAQLSLQEQSKANELWLGVQRIKSEEERAAAERELRLAIANGQLDAQYAQLAQRTQEAADRNAIDRERLGLEQGRLDLQTAETMSNMLGYVVGPDGQMVTGSGGQPIRTLAGAKFDWDKQSFTIAEANKQAYQNATLALREQQLITQQEANRINAEIRQGQISLETARVLGYMLNPDGSVMTDAEGNPVPTAQQRYNDARLAIDGAGKAAKPDNSSWTGAMGDLQDIDQQLLYGQVSQDQLPAVVQAVIAKWVPQMTDAEAEAFELYLTARGLLPQQ